MSDNGKTLQINQDLVFQRREWRVQRIGWWVLCAFVLAAALGLFGNGPLSRAQAGDPGSPLRADYQRFVRVGAPARVTIHGTTGGSGQDWQLRLSRPYFDGVRLEHVTPEPAGFDIGENDIVLHFTAQSASPRFTVILDLESLQAGRQQATFRAGAATLTFTQFSYF